MNQHLAMARQQATNDLIDDSSIDPIVDAIAAYRAGCELYRKYGRLAMSENEEKQAIAATYGPPTDVLTNWTSPARSHQGAIEALRVSIEEMNDIGAGDLAVPMVSAALAYFERATDQEDEADRHWNDVESEASPQWKPPEGYTLDDLDGDFGDLRELLNATYDILHEMPYERNGQRDVELDRVAALVRVAQQFSDKIELNLQDVGPRIGSRWVQRPSGG